MHAHAPLLCRSVLLLAAPMIAWAPAASAQAGPIYPGPHYKLVSQTPFFTNVAAHALADLNGDGKLDQATTMSFNPGGIALSFGDGLGGFAPPQYLVDSVNPAGIALPDVNADGRPDLAVGIVSSPTGSSAVSIHLGLGAGQFAPPTHFPLGDFGAYDLRPLDLNVDGKLDLAVQMSGSSSPSWRFMLGDGAGGFALSPGTPATGFAIALGDVTGDAAPDLLELVYTGQLVLEVWANNGTGTLVDQGVVATCASPSVQGLGLGDLDADGDLDAVLMAYEDAVETALGNGAGGFATPVMWSVGHPDGGLTPAIADLTGDGLADLASVSQTAKSAYVVPGDGAGGFGAAVNTFVGATPGPTQAGDLNGDGRADLALVSMDLGGIMLLLSDGPGGFPKPSSEALGVPWSVLQLADLDGDAHRDVIGLTGSVSFFQPSGYPGFATALGDGLGGFGTPTAYVPTMSAWTALVADWNGDFDLDVVLPMTSPGAHALELWQGNGLGALAPVATFVSGSGPMTDALGADVNGDGHRDVIYVPGTSTGTSSVTWTAGDGLGGFGPAVSSLPCGPDGCAKWLRMADLNADGKRDLAVITAGLQFAPPVLATYLGDGLGGFAFVAQSTANPKDFELADLSGDGFPDHVAFSVNNGISTALGLGDGTFGASIAYPYYVSSSLLNGAETIELGDLNGDGDLDVVTGASFNGTVYVFRGDGAGGLLPDRGYAARQGATSALGDVDEDGQVDIVTADFVGQAVTVLENLTPCAGTVQTYGLGCPGTSGFVPSLSVWGCPEPGKSLTFRLAGGLGGSVGFVLHGLVPAHIPLPGGCELLIDQILSAVTVMPLSAGAAGTGAKTKSFVIGPVGPSGADFAMQAVVFDPATLFSFASTNGVRLVIP